MPSPPALQTEQKTADGTRDRTLRLDDSLIIMNCAFIHILYRFPHHSTYCSISLPCLSIGVHPLKHCVGRWRCIRQHGTHAPAGSGQDGRQTPLLFTPRTPHHHFSRRCGFFIADGWVGTRRRRRAYKQTTCSAAGSFHALCALGIRACHHVASRASPRAAARCYRPAPRQVRHSA